MEVEAEIRRRRYGLHPHALDPALGAEHERHERVGTELSVAPPRNERVVLPVVQVTDQRGGLSEIDDQPIALEQDGDVAVPPIGVVSRLALERE